VLPAFGVLVLAVLTMDRSATGVTVMATLLELLPGVVSVVPDGTLTLAVLVITPVAVPATLTWNVTVADRPLAKVLAPEIRLPTAVALIPAVGTILVMVPRPAGRVSVHVALVTALGPLLTITMV
jgi:hypothetical protein